MRSTSSVGAWLVLVTLMLSSGLQGLGSVLSFGVVVLLAGTTDGWTLGLANGLVNVTVAALQGLLLVWVVLRASPVRPSLLVTALAVVAAMFGGLAGYAASMATSLWMSRVGTTDLAGYYQVMAPLWPITWALQHTSWIAAVIVAHVKGTAPD